MSLLLSLLPAGLLPGCADPAGDVRSYAAALHAPAFDDARAACLRVRDPGLQGDCLVSAIEQHDRLEAADCREIRSDLWQAECLFLYAERAARHGQMAAALDACGSTRFARACTFHLIRQAVQRQKDAPIADAAAEAARLPPMPHAPDAQGLFWRDWWREQLARQPARPTDLPPLDARDCPPTPTVSHPDAPPMPACEQGAREVLMGVMEIRIRSRVQTGHDPCAARSLPDLPWPDAPPMQGWMAEVWARNCAAG